MFKLKSLLARNFRSYKELELNNIDKLGLTLIHGVNGSGKSSIRLLLEYILTDATSEKIPLDEIAFNGDKDCEMRGVFEDEVGNDIIITKYRNHRTHKNNSYLTVGKADLSHSDRRESQKVINEVFKLGENTLGTSTIFSQLSESFPQSKDSLRKKILYDALDLHKYTAYSKQASKFIASYRGEIDTLEREILEVSSSISAIVNILDPKILKRVGKVGVYRGIIDKLMLKKGGLEGRLDSDIDFNNEKYQLSINLDKFKNCIFNRDSLYEQIDDIKKKLLDCEWDRKVINEGVAFLKSKIDGHKPTYEKFINDHNFIYRKYNNLKDLIELADKAICPIIKTHCKIIEGESYDDLIEEENKTKKELDEIETIKSNIEGEMGKITGEIKSLEGDILNIDKTYIKGSSNLQFLKAELDKTNIEIGNLVGRYGFDVEFILNAKIESIDSTIQDFSSVRNTILKLGLKINQLSFLLDSIEGMKNIQESIDSKKDKLKDLMGKLERVKSKIEYYRFWEVGFGSNGIPNMKTESLLYNLQNETNKNLNILSNELYVAIDSQLMLKNEEMREKTSYLVKSRDKDISSFFSYSGGQRQRVILADMLAFNSLLGKFNFVILDEVLDLSLDDSGKDAVISLLRQKIKEIETILVISNDSQVKNKFDSLIHVEYLDGVSELV